MPFILQCKVLHSSHRTSGYSCVVPLVPLPFWHPQDYFLHCCGCPPSPYTDYQALPSKPQWGTNPLPWAEMSNQHKAMPVPAQCTPQPGITSSQTGAASGSMEHEWVVMGVVHPTHPSLALPHSFFFGWGMSLLESNAIRVITWHQLTDLCMWTYVNILCAAELQENKKPGKWYGGVLDISFHTR